MSAGYSLNQPCWRLVSNAVREGSRMIGDLCGVVHFSIKQINHYFSTLDQKDFGGEGKLMTAALTKLTQEALTLPEPARGQLAKILLKMLDPVAKEGVEQA